METKQDNLEGHSDKELQALISKVQAIQAKRKQLRHKRAVALIRRIIKTYELPYSLEPTNRRSRK